MSAKTNIPKDADPDITLTGPLGLQNSDISGALKSASAADAKAPVPELDPDATFNGPLTAFDPDATVSKPAGRRRANPFAPKALPEALQANLAALGGINPLVAFANPILSAVPQIGAARNHPNPRLLKETLQDLIEAFEAGASKAGVSDEALEGAVYALCCLADDSAASTPWGQDWIAKGLLYEVRGESNGGEEFFALLEASSNNPEEKASLLEFLYICLALGFQGRYRNEAVADGGPELGRIRADLHALVSRRRARPAGGLSERWRGAVAQAEPPRVAHDAKARLPWGGMGAAVAAVLVLFAGYKALDQPPPTVPSSPVAAAPPAASPPESLPVVNAKPVASALSGRQAVEKALAAELQRGQIAITQDAGRTAISLRDDHQFASGNIQPAAEAQAVIGRVAEALGRTVGPILVRGYADSVPVRPGNFASNLDLSAARAKAVAELIGARIGQQQRVTSEGVGEASPIAPNDTEQNRAKNRRIAILVGARQ
jgi:type VI secretion system protein ImpK